MTVSSPMMIATSSRTSRTLLRSTSAEDSQNFSVGGRASAGLTSLEKERLSLHSECSHRFPMYFLISLRSLRFLKYASKSQFMVLDFAPMFCISLNVFKFSLRTVLHCSYLRTSKHFYGLELLIAALLLYKLYNYVRNFVTRCILLGLTDLTFIDPSFSLR